MNKRISVIIPTKNRKQDIINCLKSISIQTHPPDEVIIADSSDTEELKSVLDSFNNLNIEYHHIDIDEKFKGSSNIARNTGAYYSTGDIIIFVDDDVILDKDYITNILYVFNSDSEKGVGGVIGEVISNTIQGGFIKKVLRLSDIYSLYNQTLATIFFLTRSGNGKFRSSGFPTVIKRGSVADVTKIEYLCGCSIAFRREVFNKFKFDENLNIFGCCFGDDDDIAYRISRKYQNIYTPFAKFIHNSSPVRANRYNTAKLTIMNHYYLFKKNLPQDFKHKFAFYLSIIGLFLREGETMVIKRNSSGLKGLASGVIYVAKSKKIIMGEKT
jgi:glycosyltransferase involved in cell wall biosynthesis